MSDDPEPTLNARKIPQAAGDLPSRGNFLTRFVGRSILRVLGWKIAGVLPDEKKVMAIAAPHTSNWDFVVGVSVMLATNLKISYLGKHTLFKPPFGWFFYWLGGIPVDRSTSHGVVGESINAIDEAESVVFALAPEGTRSNRFEWKGGFHHIARGANLPLMPARFENDRKILRFGPLIHLDPEIETEEVIEQLKAFYLQENWSSFSWKKGVC